MGVADTLRDHGGCEGGKIIYRAAKLAAHLANIRKEEHSLFPDTIRRLQPIFPALVLARVRFHNKCTLPPDWYPGPNWVEGMTFGYTIYFKGKDYNTDEAKLGLLIHELAHVDQVRQRGDDEGQFACDYGIGYVTAGNYDDNVMEKEAREVETLALDTRLFWYKHLGCADGSATWANGGQGTDVGRDWKKFQHVFAGDGGVIYGVGDDGTLKWYKHLGYATGSATWEAGGPGTQVGMGWENFRHVFAGDGGVIYGVADDGTLKWYKHLGCADGSATWANRGVGTQVGTSWNFRHVFAGDGGVIYGVADDGTLKWYKHLGCADGSATWANRGVGTQVGTSWNFRHVFAGDGGVIYGVADDGTLKWYKHLGYTDGSTRYAAGAQGTQVGTGWNFRHVFAGDGGVIYGIHGV